MELDRAYRWRPAAELFPVARVYRQRVEGLTNGKRTLAEARELDVHGAYLSHLLADLAYDLGSTLTAKVFAIKRSTSWCRLRVMASWIGLVGALAGASIALLGQYTFKKLERRHGNLALLYEQCAQLVALSEDFRNRLWEERRLGREDVVAQWNLSDHRLAEAKIRILCSDHRMLLALGRLCDTGQELGKTWRLNGAEGDELQLAWTANKVAISEFIEVARSVVGRNLAQR